MPPYPGYYSNALNPGAISTSHALHKREVVTAAPSGVISQSTLDPLLVNIFGVDQPSTTTVKVPKPKPVFNDGQKLVSFPSLFLSFFCLGKTFKSLRVQFKMF